MPWLFLSNFLSSSSAALVQLSLIWATSSSFWDGTALRSKAYKMLAELERFKASISLFVLRQNEVQYKSKNFFVRVVAQKLLKQVVRTVLAFLEPFFSFLTRESSKKRISVLISWKIVRVSRESGFTREEISKIQKQVQMEA